MSSLLRECPHCEKKMVKIHSEAQCPATDNSPPTLNYDIPDDAIDLRPDDELVRITGCRGQRTVYHIFRDGRGLCGPGADDGYTREDVPFRNICTKCRAISVHLNNK